MLSRFASKTLLKSIAARQVGVAAFSTHHDTPVTPKFDFEVPDDNKTKKMYMDVIEYQLRNSSPDVQKEALDVINESTFYFYFPFNFSRAFFTIQSCSNHACKSRDLRQILLNKHLFVRFYLNDFLFANVLASYFISVILSF